MNKPYQVWFSTIITSTFKYNINIDDSNYLIYYIYNDWY